MALPANDKVIGDLGHTDDHNAIVDEISSIKASLSGSVADSVYLRQDTASATYLTQNDASNTYLTISSSSSFDIVGSASAAEFNAKAYTDTEISDLINAAPPVLDTLKELADALGNDPNFATSTASAIGDRLTKAVASATYLTIVDASNTYLPISASATLSPIGYLTASAAADIYAPLDSPSLIGTPTAPTASAGTSNSQIATTEFVSDAVIQAQSGSVDLSSYLTKDSASTIYMPLSGSMVWSNIIDKPDPTIGINLVGTVTGAASATLTDLSNAQITITTSGGGGSASSISWSNITNTPTTISGYGITDALTISSSSNFVLASTASNIYALKDSAQLTGIPTAPTASAGTNTTQIATTEFVTTAVLNAQTGSAVDLSSYLTLSSASAIYLSKESASAIYISKNDIIDCGGP